MPVIRKVFRALCSVLTAAAGVLILFSTLLTTVNACLRYFAGMPLAWADELSVYGIILPVFLVLPMLEYTNSQLAIDLLMRRVKSDAGRTAIMFIRGFLSLAAMGTLTYFGVLSAKKSFARSVVTPVLEMPKGAIYGIVAGCFAIAFIAWMLILLRKGTFEHAD